MKGELDWADIKKLDELRRDHEWWERFNERMCAATLVTVTASVIALTISLLVMT